MVDRAAQPFDRTRVRPDPLRRPISTTSRRTQMSLISRSSPHIQGGASPGRARRPGAPPRQRAAGSHPAPRRPAGSRPMSPLPPPPPLCATSTGDLILSPASSFTAPLPAVPARGRPPSARPRRFVAPEPGQRRVRLACLVPGGSRSAIRAVVDARGCAAAVHLTTRGRVAAGCLIVLVAAGLFWLAHASAPPPSAQPPAPATITVRTGDTLWSLATRLSPDRDPRLVVAQLERVNGLASEVVVPGEVLRTR